MRRLTRAWTARLATGFLCLGSGGAARGAESARTHDGFYARSAPGLALLWAHVDGAAGVPRRSGVRGVGQSGELALGGTPVRGLVVGGTLWTVRIDPVFIEGGRHV